MNTIEQRLYSADYINQLDFDYIETYSMQRGADYDVQYKEMHKEYDRLKVRKERRNNLSVEEEATFSKLAPLVTYTQYLIDGKGVFHPSSTRTNTFQQEDSWVDWLRQILKTPITEIPHFMCAPVYRDAIVFYNADGTIVSTLNICLGCMYMEISPGYHINGDYETYDLLKRFFIDIGHDVEDPHHFIMDDINKLKAKQHKPR